MNDFICPFCSRVEDNEYNIRLHIEEQHTADSPFVARQDSSSPSSKVSDSVNNQHGRHTRQIREYVQCPGSRCGEVMLSDDLDEHVAIHIATQGDDWVDQNHHARPESGSHDQKGSSSSSKLITGLSRTLSLPKYKRRDKDPGNMLDFMIGPLRSSKDVQLVNRTKKSVRTVREPGRLGERELGPYAEEESMPLEVRRHLIEDALPHYAYHVNSSGKLDRVVTVENQTSGLIRILSDLCALDPRVERTYLCHPDVKHIYKIRCEGDFCGYWNIQMVLSFLQTSAALPGMSSLPNVLDIQAGIESAWNAGICAYGRVETGGIHNTRKWIGSHEALAYFTQLGVKADAISFQEMGTSGTELTVLALLDHIEAYFLAGIDEAKAHKNTYITNLAPIYFQRFGHSMTIVGLEKKKDGFRNLLVFDSSFATARPVRKLLAGSRIVSQPESLLEPYRRSDKSLTKWSEFEVVVPRQVNTLE